MAEPVVRVEPTASFLERLAAIESFLTEADAASACDRLPGELRSTVIPNLRSGATRPDSKLFWLASSATASESRVWSQQASHAALDVGERRTAAGAWASVVEADVVADPAIARIGHRDDRKNMLDLVRWLLPKPPVPLPWRWRMRKEALA